MTKPLSDLGIKILRRLADSSDEEGFNADDFDGDLSAFQMVVTLLHEFHRDGLIERMYGEHINKGAFTTTSTASWVAR